MRTLAAGAPVTLDDDLLIAGDNLVAMATLPAGAFDMAYLDPPFNTGVERRRGEHGYVDAFEDYGAFLAPRLARVRELLAPHGTLYLHLDYREAHRCKLALDELFGPQCFLNEIIWVYDYGGRPKRRWPAKHDTILVYVRDRDRYHFDDAEVDREPYMAPGLVGPEKAARGKRPSDCWWHTIVPTNSREKTGYPTQKPEGILRRMVGASSRPGGWCLDPFAGSGTLGAACRALGRRFVLVDANPAALAISRARLEASSLRLTAPAGTPAPSA